MTHLTFRASPALVRRLDELVAATGKSRSGAIKAAILAASTPGEAPPVADEREVLELLSEAARSGNVPAMRELLAHHREHCQPAAFDPVKALDELAERRVR